MTARRSKGEGSVYYDAGRKVWTGVIDLGTVNGRRTRRKVSGATRTEARAKLDELREQKRKAGTVARGNLTVAQIMAELLSNPPPKWKSEITLKVNARHAQRVTDALGNVKVVKLTAAQVETFLRGLGADGLSTRVINSTRGILRLALGRAMTDHGLGQNVAGEVLDKRVPAGTRRESRPMTPQEIDKLLGSDLTPFWRALITAGIMTGMRVGELLGLRWQDVNLDAGLIEVRHSLKKENGALVVTGLKNAWSKGTIGLHPHVVTALRALRKHQAEQRLALGPAYADNDLVFANEQGRPKRRQHILRDFQRCCEVAGIGRYQAREMRTSCASYLHHKGVPIGEISKLLRHKNTLVTQQVYIKVFADEPAMAAAGSVWDGIKAEQETGS